MNSDKRKSLKITNVKPSVGTNQNSLSGTFPKNDKPRPSNKDRSPNTIAYDQKYKAHDSKTKQKSASSAHGLNKAM